jgi:hypothetical protein
MFNELMGVSSSKPRTIVRCHTQRERSTLYMRRPLIVTMLKDWSPGTVTAGTFLLPSSSQTSRIAQSSEKTDSLVGCVEHARYAVRYAMPIWCNRKI